MKYFSKITPILALLFLFWVGIFSSSAQKHSVKAPAGDYLQGQNATVSFTLGEPVILTLQKADKIITQGFQQSSLIVTAIEELAGLGISIEVYPNPVYEELRLELSVTPSADAFYALYDMNGALISRKQLDGLQTRISFQGLAAATYLFSVNQGNNSLKTFKIIKK